MSRPATLPSKVTISVEDAVRAAQAKKPLVVTPDPDDVSAHATPFSVVSEVPAETLKSETDKTLDTLDQFERKVSYAHATGTQWVETTENVIKTFVPKGLGDARYFIYKNVRVALKGTAAEVQESESKRKHEGSVDMYA